MKSVLLALIFCLVLNEVFGNVLSDWLKFKNDFNKSYKSKSEERRRFSIFKKNLKEINRHNKRFRRGFETFEKGVTIFADLTKKQFDKKYGLRSLGSLITYDKLKKNPKKFMAKNSSSEHLDWRDRGAVSEVKEQGVCGACWIFSAVGMLEGYNFIKTGQLISLSEQSVVDCFSNTSCEGGFPGEAIMFAKENGVSKEIDYPYSEQQHKCKASVPRIKIDFNGYDFLNGTEQDLKLALDKYGPLGVSLYVSGNWRLYKRGVWYERKCSNLTNHAVVLVGYGSENGNDYWLIKNSWGKNWGENGFIKIARNKHENYCGLTHEAMFIY